MIRKTLPLTILILITALLMAACATTPIGKAIQSGEGAKLAVESAAEEVIRLKERGLITDENYVKAREAYTKWAQAQKVYAEAVVAWSRAKTAQADARVQAALTNLGNALNAAADTLCAFKSSSPVLAAACVQLGR